MQLRTYQLAAVESALSARKRGVLRPLIVLPTGAGKSLVLATIARRIVDGGGRVLIVAHVRELLEQNSAACRAVGLSPGLYSAGLDERDAGSDVVVAGIQSAFRVAPAFGWRDVVLVDEAHLIRADGDGMYHSLLHELREANPEIQLIGLTATPYRTGSGLLTDGDPPLFDEVVHSTGVVELIDAGYLCKLTSKAAGKPDLTGVRTIAGDWKADELEERMLGHVDEAVADLFRRAADRKKILVFGVGVEHCKAISHAIEKRWTSAPVVTGETPSDERRAVVNGFRAGEHRFLVNCGVFTTGFDVPTVDCIALMRPTKSPGLYYQMTGRGLRIAPGKADCLILDYGENVRRHGPIDKIRPAKTPRGNGEAPTKECPSCAEVVYIGCMTCPACAYEWQPEPKEAKTDRKASEIAIIGHEPQTFRVSRWFAQLHKSKRTGSLSVRVTYWMHDSLFSVDQYVCFGHKSAYAAMLAEEWWMRHGGKPEPIPATAGEALRRWSELRRPDEIITVEDGQWTKVLRTRYLPPSNTPAEAGTSSPAME